MNQINWPTIHITGWYDIFLQHQIDSYNLLRQYGNDDYKNANYLFVGSLGHCLIANINPDYDNYDGYELRGIGIEYASEMFKSMSQGTGPFGKGPFSKMIKKINIFVQGPIRHRKYENDVINVDNIGVDNIGDDNIGVDNIGIDNIGVDNINNRNVIDIDNSNYDRDQSNNYYYNTKDNSYNRDNYISIQNITQI